MSKKRFTVDLAGYLKHLSEQEQGKLPNERRPVPTLSHLAEVAGISRQAMSDFANGKTQLANLTVLYQVIIELRRWGFTDTDLHHILVPEEQ